MKFKKLTKEQLIISFDRLTRFKPTREKYYRVFSDIILSNLTEPSYKRQELSNMPANEITKIAVEIINSSLNDISGSTQPFQTGKGLINLLIKDYENSIFVNDEETQNYLDNDIYYGLFIPLIDEAGPINLKWLKAVYNKRTERHSEPLERELRRNLFPSSEESFRTQNLCHSERSEESLKSYGDSSGQKNCSPQNDNKMVILSDSEESFRAQYLCHSERSEESQPPYNSLIKLRHEYGLKYPVEKVLLVEGLTEEILLPAFSKYLGFDFYKHGIQVIAAGGKNQVVKMYYKLIEELRLPIFILLDKDAEENISQIKPKLREVDKIHLVSCGEFEDLLPKSLIIKTVNNELSNFAAITENDLDKEIPAAKNLENIFKTKGLHEFKKADFAKMVRDNITEDSDISAEIASIVMELGL